MSNLLNRREFIKLTAAQASLLFLASAGCGGGESNSRSGVNSIPVNGAENIRTTAKNVLFISIDDLNDWVGCLGGHPDVQTPNIDRLAERGVLFTNAHCSAPVCNPSRTSLMTGILPSNSGIYTNKEESFRISPVLNSAETIPQSFMKNGYRVVGGGKIFHHSDPASWQEYYPSFEKQTTGDARPPNAPLNGIPNCKNFDWGPLPEDITDEKMGDWNVASWAVDELGKEHDSPFFLGVGIYKPHLPWYVPQKYFDMYPLETITLPIVNDNDLDDVPPLGKDRAYTGVKGSDHDTVLQYDQWRQAVQGYLACISFADAQVGRVLDALDQSPYADDTAIVLWSDHGWHLGEKLHWRKFTPWEEATHNPLIMVAPGVTTPGSRCSRAVSLLDIYPTLMHLFGFDPPGNLDGQNLASLLSNPEAERLRPVLTTVGKNNHALRSERWRYIRYEDGTEELYDHENDDLEWHNLADDPAYADIKIELANWLPEVNADEI